MTQQRTQRLAKAICYFSMGLVALSLLGACGGKKTEDATSTKARPKSDQKNKPTPSSNRMAIPFDVAVQAALSGHTDTVKQALETGTDPNQIDENGRTLLMVAAYNGHIELVRTLLAAQAKVDTQDFAGRTALMYASTGKYKDTVALLLEHKAKVDLVDGEEHWSALMFAAAEGNMEVVQLLLKAEADTQLVDIDGSTAESFARDNGHIQVADLLKSWGE